MDAWCKSHRERFIDGANEADRTIELLFALSLDPAYAKTKAERREASTNEERERLEREARAKFMPACCYLGERKLRELFE